MTLFADITTTRRAGNKFCMSLANCSPIRSEASHLVISTSTSNLKKNNFVWDCFDVRTDNVEVRCMGVVFSAGMRVCQHNSAYTCECVWAYMSMKITCTWIFLYKHVCISGNIYKCSAWPVVSICHFGNSTTSQNQAAQQAVKRQICRAVWAGCFVPLFPATCFVWISFMWEDRQKHRHYVHIDWCCFYYFLRNSLVALLEALFARTCIKMYTYLKTYFWWYMYGRTDVCMKIQVHRYAFTCMHIYVYMHRWITWVYIYTRTHALIRASFIPDRAKNTWNISHVFSTTLNCNGPTCFTMYVGVCASMWLGVRVRVRANVTVHVLI